MKPSRWRPRIWNGLALFSLVVFVSAVAMEVRGYFATDILCVAHGTSAETFGCERGFLIYEHAAGFPPDAQFTPLYRSFRSNDSTTTSPLSGSIWFLGNMFWRYDYRGQTSRMWCCPLWQVMALSFPLAALFAKHTISRRRRAQTGHCPACGYDLRHPGPLPRMW